LQRAPRPTPGITPNIGRFVVPWQRLFKFRANGFMRKNKPLSGETGA
jgi:hypothetical protein